MKNFSQIIHMNWDDGGVYEGLGKISEDFGPEPHNAELPGCVIHTSYNNASWVCEIQESACLILMSAPCSVSSYPLY